MSTSAPDGCSAPTFAFPWQPSHAVCHRWQPEGCLRRSGARFTMARHAVRSWLVAAPVSSIHCSWRHVPERDAKGGAEGFAACRWDGEVSDCRQSGKREHRQRLDCHAGNSSRAGVVEAIARHPAPFNARSCAITGIRGRTDDVTIDQELEVLVVVESLRTMTQEDAGAPLRRDIRCSARFSPVIIQQAGRRLRARKKSCARFAKRCGAASVRASRQGAGDRAKTRLCRAER